MSPPATTAQVDAQPVRNTEAGATADDRPRLPGRVAARVRKTVLYCEDVLAESGTGPARPARQAVVAAVIENPWLGTGPATDLSPEVEVIAPVLAKALTGRLIDALGGVDAIEAFGKAAIVGTAGEIEHAGALIHTPWFGNLMRDFLEGESIICFADVAWRRRGDAGGAHVAQDGGGHPQPLPDDLCPSLRRPARGRDRRAGRGVHRTAPARPHRRPHNRPDRQCREAGA